MSARDSAAYWNARWAEAAEAPFGEAPNEFLRMVLARSDVSVRRALMIADGDGRNGAWLAAQGARVSAIDISEEGVRRALARDRAMGVEVAREVADVRAWRPAPGRAWDFCAILFLQGPAEQRRAAVRLGARALAPGGWLALEGFCVGDAPGAPGPDRPSHRYGPEEVAGWLGDLVIEELMSGDVRLKEGRRHSGVARILRLLARRPA